MTQLFRILQEGIAQAWSQLMGNKLRSFLSLLGITIGIFCIIGVKSAVNSLEDNIRKSVKKLGDDVVYVEKFSWAEDPGQNFWKWMRRPNPTFREFEMFESKLTTAEKLGFWMFLGNKTIKWENSNVEGCFMLGITYDIEELFHLEFDNGRYLNSIEYETGSDVCLLGHTISDGLFGSNIDPIGKTITYGGHKMRVIGTLKGSGKDLLKPFNFDNAILIGFTLGRRIGNVRPAGQWTQTSLLAKAKTGVSIDDLRDEITANLRQFRHIKPREENNFALNQLSIISKLFDSVFSVLNGVGFVIGIFSLIVGGFSVANIMFVSVKERTSIIGIKKALGAKRWFILLEFLIESIILCLVGGAFGLLFIWLLVTGISKGFDFDIHLSVENVSIGVFASVLVGVLAGFIPAFQASKMDPVEAMRK
jgi:putative ABC transport system permease protein